jgi:peptidoglycan biosynthesis protein MviN/MurJ (putative lipid II flippase)
VLAIVLVGRYGVLGLGLAFAIAYVISSCWALVVLGYKVPGFSPRSIAVSLAPMLLAALLMAEAVWVVAQRVGGDVGTEAAIRLIVGTVVGVVVYLAVLVALGVPELDFLRRRFGGTIRLGS